MEVTFLPIVTFVRPVQSLNASKPTMRTLSGMETVLRFVQSRKHAEGITLIRLGRETLNRPLQPEKALGSRLVTLSGMRMAGRLVHPANAAFPMPLSPLGKVIGASRSQP